MEKKNNLKNVLIVVLVLLLGVLLVYIGCDKLMNKDNNQVINHDNKENNNDNQNNNEEELTEIEKSLTEKRSTYGSLEAFFEEYIKYIPCIFDDNSNLVSYHVSNLKDKDISMAVWRYIYYKNNGLPDEKTKLSKAQVESYLKEYLNLVNYKIKTMPLTDDNMFLLEEKENNYVISTHSTEFEFPRFEVSSVSFDKNTNKVFVNANQFYYEMGSEEKTIVTKLVIEYQYNDGNYNLVKVDI